MKPFSFVALVILKKEGQEENTDKQKFPTTIIKMCAGRFLYKNLSIVTLNLSKLLRNINGKEQNEYTSLFPGILMLKITGKY